jgi:hypothetical protein
VFSDADLGRSVVGSSARLSPSEQCRLRGFRLTPPERQVLRDNEMPRALTTRRNNRNCSRTN